MIILARIVCHMESQKSFDCIGSQKLYNIMYNTVNEVFYTMSASWQHSRD